MYLSRIELTEEIGNHSQLGRLLQRNSYGMHSLLWDLFEKGERFLFREESCAEQLSQTNNRPIYYVLSRQEPLKKSPLFSVNTKTFLPQLSCGDHLGFKLRANPTIAKRVEGHKNSKRHDIVMDAQLQIMTKLCLARDLTVCKTKKGLKTALLHHADFEGAKGAQRFNAEIENAVETAMHKWLAERGDRNGYSLISTEGTGYRWKALPEKGKRAGFSSLDYEGVLTVTDPDKFLACLRSGLGSAKAFGCGLMLIRRI